MDSSTVIYDYVYPMIRNIRDSHLKLETGIVSSKLRYRVGSILRLNGLDTSFSVIVGADDVANGKPDPEGILLAIRKLGVDPASAVYVGDHCVDAMAAKNAGVPFVATLSGTHSRRDFAPYPCRAIVSHLGDLPSVLSL
jgi:phosphoglycolate phosphatase